MFTMERFGRRLERINERELEKQREEFEVKKQETKAEFEARQERIKELLRSVPDFAHLV